MEKIIVEKFDIIVIFIRINKGSQILKKYI